MGMGRVVCSTLGDSGLTSIQHPHLHKATRVGAKNDTVVNAVQVATLLCTSQWW